MCDECNAATLYTGDFDAITLRFGFLWVPTFGVSYFLWMALYFKVAKAFPETFNNFVGGFGFLPSGLLFAALISWSAIQLIVSYGRVGFYLAITLLITLLAVCIGAYQLGWLSELMK